MHHPIIGNTHNILEFPKRFLKQTNRCNVKICKALAVDRLSGTITYYKCKRIAFKSELKYKLEQTISMSDMIAQLLVSNVSVTKVQIHVEMTLALEKIIVTLRNGIDKRTATPQTIGSPLGFRRRYLKYRNFLNKYYLISVIYYTV